MSCKCLWANQLASGDRMLVDNKLEGRRNVEKNCGKKIKFERRRGDAAQNFDEPGMKSGGTPSEKKSECFLFEEKKIK
jgi:hypothetical protein